MVAASTGSNLIGRASNGQRVHVGGWGPVVADEGSGSWIGKRAVRAVFDALDRDEETLLMKKIQEAWELERVIDLVDVANRIPGPTVFKARPHRGRMCATLRRRRHSYIGAGRPFFGNLHGARRATR